MNFVFTITAHGFEKAGKLEAALKDMGIPYECKLSPNRSNSTGGRKRKVMNKAEVMAVASTITAHPDWSDRTIASQAGVGSNTVNRIRRGIHPLCEKDTS